jgi:hypothetical protein
VVDLHLLTTATADPTRDYGVTDTPAYSRLRFISNCFETDHLKRASGLPGVNAE